MCGGGGGGSGGVRACVHVCVCVRARARALNSLYGQAFALYKYFSVRETKTIRDSERQTCRQTNTGRERETERGERGN